MREAVNDSPLVVKFGGTSVGGGAAFSRAASIAAEAARDRPVAVVVSAVGGATNPLLRTASRGAAPAAGAARGRPVAVVVSAMSGVTNLLLGHASGVVDPDGSAAEELREALAERHLRAIREAVALERRARVEERVLQLLDELV